MPEIERKFEKNERSEKKIVQPVKVDTRRFKVQSVEKLNLLNINFTPAIKETLKQQNWVLRSVESALDLKNRIPQLSLKVTPLLENLKKQIIIKPPEFTKGNNFDDAGGIAFKAFDEKKADKMPGFMYRRNFSTEGGDIMTGMQLLDGSLMLGTKIDLYSSKLPTGILSTQYLKTEIDTFLGANYSYEIKNYGEIFEVRAGLASDGTRTLKIKGNIKLSLYDGKAPDFTLSFTAGFNPEKQIDKDIILKDVRIYRINCNIKFPKSKVLTVSYERTNAKLQTEPVNENSYNLNLSLPFGKGHNILLYGTVSQQTVGSNREVNVNAGAFLELRFD